MEENLEKNMKTGKTTIKAEDVEVINTSAEPEKITKVRVDEDSGNSNNGGMPSMEEMLEQMKNGGVDTENDPMMKMMGNMAEIKKIKAYFLVALLAGFWSLFGWTNFMAPLALVFGALDLALGSKLTEKASYVGMIFAIFGLLMAHNLI